MTTAQSVGTYQHIAMRIYPRHVTPECLNSRGSSVLTWIPDEAFGNDGLQEVWE
jgi:hypothetical protein